MKRGGDAALAALEERLGHAFSDRQLLATALTHPSASAGGRASYQRLEFLGDRVLGLVIAEMLFQALPEGHGGRAVAPARRTGPQGNLRRSRGRDSISARAIRVGGPRRPEQWAAHHQRFSATSARR